MNRRLHFGDNLAWLRNTKRILEAILKLRQRAGRLPPAKDSVDGT